MTAFPKLSYVCPIRWNELRGDEREKFCTQCGHRVNNLSAISQVEREALLAKAGTERLCVSFYRRLSGEYVTAESPLTSEERSNIRQLGVAALSAGALALAAGCVSVPTQPARAASKETKRVATASADQTVVLQAFGMIAVPDAKNR
jgi:hypothetical protein